MAPLLGLGLYSQAPSESVTALSVPAGLDSQKLRLQLEEKHHITIMGGQDQAKGKILRVGHMGYIPPEEMNSLILGLREILVEADPRLQVASTTELQEKMRRFWHA